MATATLKRLLPDTETELFYNWDDTDNEVSCISMTFCNTSASPVTVSVSFVELSGAFNNGVIFSEFEIAGNESVYRSIPKRVIKMDESIRGFASVADVVAFSADLENVDQRLIPTPDV
jgi:hypothetical protein